MSTTQADWAKTALRLPRDMHTKVHEEAKRNDRTFNGQIVAMLRQALQPKQEAEHADAA